MILILDCGTGNFSSVARMINLVGGDCEIGHEIKKLESASKIILPGVGHFDNGMKSIHENGLRDTLESKVKNDKIPILGICLGMQLMCRMSEEGNEVGLGFIEADVEKFKFNCESKLKIPHMGWNVVQPTAHGTLLPLSADEQRFYFVHSYKVVPDSDNITTGVADYGGMFCAAFQKDNIYGVQFHPEKSHRFGLNLIKRFVEV